MGSTGNGSSKPLIVYNDLVRLVVSIHVQQIMDAIFNSTAGTLELSFQLLEERAGEWIKQAKVSPY